MFENLTAYFKCKNKKCVGYKRFDKCKMTRKYKKCKFIGKMKK